MKKGLVLVITLLLCSIPVISVASQPELKTVEETTLIQCVIGKNLVEKELPLSTVQELIDMGASHRDDFMTIYDKRKPDEEVALAFENVQPFFEELVNSGLTDKTVEDLNNLFHHIRSKVRAPRRADVTIPDDGPQTKGLWNGVPTPMWANVMCGIFDAGFVVGFTLGTHTLIPTIGADLFTTYVFQGSSLSLGLAGFTVAVAAFQVILGFLGVLIATPGIMLGPYFMTGVCGMMFGLGL